MDEFLFSQGRIFVVSSFLCLVFFNYGQIILHSLIFQAKMEVEDLFVDLADGVKLLKLLEIISGEKLGKPNNGRMRVHKIENLNKSLAFLHTKVSTINLKCNLASFVTEFKCEKVFLAKTLLFFA